MDDVSYIAWKQRFGLKDDNDIVTVETTEASEDKVLFVDFNGQTLTMRKSVLDELKKFEDNLFK